MNHFHQYIMKKMDLEWLYKVNQIYYKIVKQYWSLNQRRKHIAQLIKETIQRILRALITKLSDLNLRIVIIHKSYVQDMKYLIKASAKPIYICILQKFHLLLFYYSHNIIIMEMLDTNLQFLMRVQMLTFQSLVPQVKQRNRNLKRKRQWLLRSLSSSS